MRSKKFARTPKFSRSSELSPKRPHFADYLLYRSSAYTCQHPKAHSQVGIFRCSWRMSGSSLLREAGSSNPELFVQFYCLTVKAKTVTAADVC